MGLARASSSIPSEISISSRRMVSRMLDDPRIRPVDVVTGFQRDLACTPGLCWGKPGGILGVHSTVEVTTLG